MKQVVALSLIFVAACSSASSTFSENGSKRESGTKADTESGGTFTSAPDGGMAPAAGQPGEVWGHSPDTLYKLEPTSKAVTVVGAFSGCTGVFDIALDASSNLFGTAADGLFRIDAKTAACTRIASGSYPNSLSFVPKGTVDPNVEALVGYEGSDYVRIDTSTGAKTQLGSIGSGLFSSGDIVSVKGGSTYLTVTGTGCAELDCLIEVNPATGALVKNWGSIQHAQVYGLAFWAGSVYGFAEGGDLFEVTFAGGVLATTIIPIPSKPAGLQFWGAGSTTSAPVTPPN